MFLLDLKSENILVDETENLLLCNFTELKISPIIKSKAAKANSIDSTLIFQL